MKIPGVFFAVILTILSPASATFADIGIPPNLQECFMRMSRSSNSYHIFSPASRQSYCLKQYLNRRRRADWLEPSLIPDTDGFKDPNLTPFEPQFDDPTSFWSPPIKRWQLPTVNNFWQPRTQFWPVVQQSFDKKWPAVRTTKAPEQKKISTTQKPETTTSISISTPRQEVLRIVTKAPIVWRQKKSFDNNVQSNPPQRSRIWRAPMWAVVSNSALGRRFNNRWRYPDWSLDYPWNGYYNAYGIPEYPVLEMDWVPE